MDKLATSGLPLWITELNLRQADENIRADWFEDVLTAYFSHPAVDGVILWGFWDHDGTPTDGTFCDGNALYVSWKHFLFSFLISLGELTDFEKKGIR